MRITQWLLKFWAHRFIVATVLLPVAFFVGRWTAPAPAAQVRTETVTRTEYKDRVVVKEVAGATRVVYRDRTIYRDGPIQERVVEKEGERVEVVREIEKKTDSVQAQETRVEVSAIQPTWRVGVLVGADLSPQWQPIPGAGVLSIGGTIQHRLAGPLWVGGFALSTGVAGVSATIDF
jgi:hypothetical protein